MFSGKTSSTIDRFDEMRGDAILFKPSMDTRYAESEVVSHDGERAPARSISEFPVVEPYYTMVILDEIQFFDIGVVEWVRSLLAQGIDIHAAGLDMDWQGQPFAVSGQLAAMADVVVKKRARCAVCRAEATKTFKFDQHESVVVELGSADKYEPRCQDHFMCS